MDSKGTPCLLHPRQDWQSSAWFLPPLSTPSSVCQGMLFIKQSSSSLRNSALASLAPDLPLEPLFQNGNTFTEITGIHLVMSSFIIGAKAALTSAESIFERLVNFLCPSVLVIGCHSAQISYEIFKFRTQYQYCPHFLFLLYQSDSTTGLGSVISVIAINAGYAQTLSSWP